MGGHLCGAAVAGQRGGLEGVVQRCPSFMLCMHGISPTPAQIPFQRAWCLVEISAARQADSVIVVKWGAAVNTPRGDSVELPNEALEHTADADAASRQWWFRPGPRILG